MNSKDYLMNRLYSYLNPHSAHVIYENLYQILPILEDLKKHKDKESVFQYKDRITTLQDQLNIIKSQMGLEDEL